MHTASTQYKPSSLHQQLTASSCHGNALPSPGQLPVCCVLWQLDPSEPPTCVYVCAYVYMSVSKKGVITNYSFSHALVYKPVIIHKSGTCNKAYETVQSKSLKVKIQKHGFIGEWNNAEKRQSTQHQTRPGRKG